MSGRSRRSRRTSAQETPTSAPVSGDAILIETRVTNANATRAWSSAFRHRRVGVLPRQDQRRQRRSTITTASAVPAALESIRADAASLSRRRVVVRGTGSFESARGARWCRVRERRSDSGRSSSPAPSQVARLPHRRRAELPRSLTPPAGTPALYSAGAIGTHAPRPSARQHVRSVSLAPHHAGSRLAELVFPTVHTQSPSTVADPSSFITTSMTHHALALPLPPASTTTPYAFTHTPTQPAHCSPCTPLPPLARSTPTPAEFRAAGVHLVVLVRRLAVGRNRPDDHDKER